MTEKSDRVMTLLQELAGLKDIHESGTRVDISAGRKRRKEIGEQIKQLAKKKKE